ncbi:ABC transporter ATP-binding protein [Paenibacillus sp. FSL H8-0548]|uniref:ABC transporter ATP-binding protein n=1 Tax=Paenibacillus sp. FSL H8-0548 TaxID=1920422 RepID=UPI00096F8D27|nr:ATP-binding cassette domain-containing protein [Paenibacillus sp. FSL H8-0548]OMF34663.1 ABC transporter ATP-binding protein [Paenibacillus sp. FSL H8-0548]
MSCIEVKELTKDYGDGRGVFDINLSIEQGEVFGFVGINGAGKTTIIRHFTGFLKPQIGHTSVKGLDCWKDADKIKCFVGYVPGEIAFPDAPTGTAFLQAQAALLGLTDFSYMDSLIKRLQLDPSANLKRMSKGMKQKTAIVAALMADPEILILDEPTTGLDPLMRAEFVSILQEEKKKGKTIFMSSHIFEEVEETCDKVAMIKDGKIIAVKSTAEVKYNENKVYQIAFATEAAYKRFAEESFDWLAKDQSKQEVAISLHDHQINTLFRTLTAYDVLYMTETKYTLEQYFNSLYEGGSLHA